MHISIPDQMPHVLGIDKKLGWRGPQKGDEPCSALHLSQDFSTLVTCPGFLQILQAAPLGCVWSLGNRCMLCCVVWCGIVLNSYIVISTSSYIHAFVQGSVFWTMSIFLNRSFSRLDRPCGLGCIPPTLFAIPMYCIIIDLAVPCKCSVACEVGFVLGGFNARP